MKRFKNILLVSNGQESDKHSLRRAAGLAERNNAKLSLIEVIEAPIEKMTRLAPKLKGLDFSALMIEDRKAAIKKLLKSARLPLLPIEVLFGVPFIEITRRVKRNGYDLVIMGTEGQGGIKERLFGATSLHLIRKCPCPVWIHKPIRANRYSRILAAVDPNKGDPLKASLNRKIMELATSMAETEKGELHLVHVWDFMGENLLVRRGGMSRQEVDAAIEESREKHRQALEKLAEAYLAPTSGIKLHLLRGYPGDAIPACAKKNRANLLVLGTVSRQGIAGLIIGNTAEHILQRVNASVLTVKPKGFVSPVP